jgi:hypothetical protein
LFALSLYALTSPLAAWEPENHDVALSILSLEDARAPYVVADSIVFSYSGPARAVGIAFDYERYSRIHSFSYFETRVGTPGRRIYVYSIPVPLGKDLVDIGYRLIVDGLWIRDPRNPLTRFDSLAGVGVSIARVQARDDKVAGLYRHLGDDGMVHFYYAGERGARICLVGDFNGWDPFLHELTETQPGIYELELRLPSGERRYAFVVNGMRVSDPLNPRREWDASGRPLSVLSVP